jgi:hypothetical protein
VQACILFVNTRLKKTVMLRRKQDFAVKKYIPSASSMQVSGTSD